MSKKGNFRREEGLVGRIEGETEGRLKWRLTGVKGEGGRRSFVRNLTREGMLGKREGERL